MPGDNDNTNDKKKKIKWRQSYFECKDSDKDEMEDVLLAWQDPDDEGEKVTRSELHTWTLEELQGGCTSARIQREMEVSMYGHALKGWSKVVKPTAERITELRKLQKGIEQQGKQQQGKGNKNDNGNKNEGEKEKNADEFKFTDLDDHLQPMGDIDIETNPSGRITGKRTRRQFEDDDYILDYNDNENNNNSNNNSNDFNSLSRSILNQTNRRMGRKNTNSNGRPKRNKTRRNVNK